MAWAIEKVSVAPQMGFDIGGIISTAVGAGLKILELTQAKKAAAKMASELKKQAAAQAAAVQAQAEEASRQQQEAVAVQAQVQAQKAKSYLPWVVGGAGLVGLVIFLGRKK